MTTNPMRAALYLRKSTDEQADSIETQRASAERFCGARGWAIVAAFEDSGISRTEFSPERRRGWFALQASAAARMFDVVVVRDVSRIGGNIGRALVFVEDLLQAGARLFCYVDGREVTGANALECVTLALQFFGAQTEVEAIRSRTYEALLVKARRGHVAGGAVYGYRNRPSDEIVTTSRGQRHAFVERVVDETQADVVRRIFARYAAGDGLRTIARALNEDRIPSPRAGGRGIGTWVPSVLHVMLRRPLYAGRIEWGHTHKTYRGGSKVRLREHDRELVVIEAPQLRIVPPELWQAVSARVGAAAHRKSPGAPARHLLSGILRCGVCGGPVTVAHSKQSYSTVKVYACQRRRDRGQSTCSSSVRRPIELVDTLVVDWVRRIVLRPRVIETVLDRIATGVSKMLRAGADDVRRVDAEAKRLERQIANLTETLADAPPEARAAVLDGMAQRQARRGELLAKLAAMRVGPAQQRKVVEAVRARAGVLLDDLHSTLAARAAAARRLLAVLFRSGLRMLPHADPGFAIVQGVASVGKDLLVKWASPAGIETLPVGDADEDAEVFELDDVA